MTRPERLNITIQLIGIWWGLGYPMRIEDDAEKQYLLHLGNQAREKI